MERLGLVLVGSALALSGCSAIVESQLAARAVDSGTPDSGMCPLTTCPACTTTDDCFAHAEFGTDCTVECISGQCRHGNHTPDGTTCHGTGGDTICVNLVCTMRRCGDGFDDRSTVGMLEYCDDGNMIDNDSCNNHCTRSCGPGFTIPDRRLDPCDGQDDCLPPAECALPDGGIGANCCHVTQPQLADGTACMAQVMVDGGTATISGHCLNHHCAEP